MRNFLSSHFEQPSSLSSHKKQASNKMSKIGARKAQDMVSYGRAKKPVSIQRLLEWAFRRERVQLELPKAEEAMIGAGYGIGSSLRLIRRAELGCRIDGGGSSPCHEDAETVAAILSHLSDVYGGHRFAAQMAEWARMGITPDWMPGAQPKVVPAIIEPSAKGGRPTRSVVAGIDAYDVDGRLVEYEVRVCPITWSPSPSQIAAARREYMRWRLALREVRLNLVTSGMLRAHELTDAMPPQEPWSKSS
ncbi:hypothetical protein QCN27_03840 [Cereibacter sp. SYSU M97828]|nr:hypothetical protein [Cereibacter flavus]